MRKVVWSMFVSLDGVVETPAWTMPYWNDEIAQFKGDENNACDALLLGRVTYEGFAQAWPTSTDEGADRMNSLPKYVATRTLTEPTWNATFIEGDVVTAVSQLKQQPGQDILIYGSVDLAHTLIKHNLIDQYNLLIYPVVLGSGLRLFKEGCQTKLRLIETKKFSSGAVALIYQPETQA